MAELQARGSDRYDLWFRWIGVTHRAAPCDKTRSNQLRNMETSDPDNKSS